jgi:DNA-directed RNA polymerase specialized sigma24 family protein
MDRTAFEDQVVGLPDDLLGTAMRLAKNRQDAEDLVAKAVTKAWANRGSLHGILPLRELRRGDSARTDRRPR